MKTDVAVVLNLAMKTCYIDRLSDELLYMIFEVACEEEQAIFQDSLSTHWNGWMWRHANPYFDERPGQPPSLLISALGVCERWKCLLSQMPSMWTVFQLFYDGSAACLEHARTFLQHSGTLPLKITLLWDHLAWIERHRDSPAGPDPELCDATSAGIDLVLLIKELYTHVHRWHEFTLRTTSVTHTYQALLLLSRHSIHPPCILEKLHLEIMHNSRNATPIYSSKELELFPGSAPPICDLLLCGVDWHWLSLPKFSLHLVNLQIAFNTYMDSGAPRATGDIWLDILRELPNLQNLSLELNTRPFDSDPMPPIVLSHLRSLAIRSRSLTEWVSLLGCVVHMPNLRVLILDGVAEQVINLESIIEGLAKLADPTDDTGKLQTRSFLELDELHLLNFNFTFHIPVHAMLVRRLYKEIATIKVLSLGPGSGDRNIALVTGLLPTSEPSELADFPLPELQTLIIFDVPKDIMRRVVLRRMSLAGPLVELYYKEHKTLFYDSEDENTSISDDWQHQVENYHHIRSVKTSPYRDIVNGQWSLYRTRTVH
ncbi:hypothetical protein M405DRAFT_933086 [Rhizopogon salebrosus TDB-379]|nr:hypothetical protein M405DRAFT_933086 [Rhizopogon salebrosus TDB-379]